MLAQGGDFLFVCAMETFAELLDHHPDADETRLDLAVLLLSGGDVTGARRHLEQLPLLETGTRKAGMERLEALAVAGGGLCTRGPGGARAGEARGLNGIGS